MSNDSQSFVNLNATMSHSTDEVEITTTHSLINSSVRSNSFFRNPQDDNHTASPLRDDSNLKRSKPSRIVLNLRNVLNRKLTRKQKSMLVLGVLMTVVSFHRLFSIYMSHRKWINAPITYMERTCPKPEYSTLHQHQKICITTLTDSENKSMRQKLFGWRNYDGIMELSWSNKQKYATKHGYVLENGSHLLDKSRPPAWTKILAVQHLLDDKQPDGTNRCDWVMWLDADTVIMNSNVRVEDFLPADTTHDLLVAADNGWGYNSGVWIVRNSEWSRKFLQDWWDMRSFVRPVGLSLSGDNAAMKHLLADMEKTGEFKEHVIAPVRCTINSFAVFLEASNSMKIMRDLTQQPWYESHDYYHKGDFIAHTPGYDNKAECIQLLLAEAK